MYKMLSLFFKVECFIHIKIIAACKAIPHLVLKFSTGILNCMGIFTRYSGAQKSGRQKQTFYWMYKRRSSAKILPLPQKSNSSAGKQVFRNHYGIQFHLYQHHVPFKKRKKKWSKHQFLQRYPLYTFQFLHMPPEKNVKWPSSAVQHLSITIITELKFKANVLYS